VLDHISEKRGLRAVLDRPLSLVRKIRTYWIMSGHETCVDWWTRAVIWVIDRGTLYAEYPQRGGMRVKK
jgi:hypothetical protein